MTEGQDSVSPPRQLHWWKMYDINISRFQSPLKASNFQGKAWKINCHIISINFSSQQQWLHSLSGSCAHISGEAFTQFVGARVSNKNPVMQISGICVIVTDCCIRTGRCQYRERKPLLLQFPSLFQDFPPLAEVTSRGFKGLKSYLLHHFSLFLPFENQTLRLEY